MKRAHYDSIDSTDVCTSTSDGNIFNSLKKDGLIIDNPFSVNQNSDITDQSDLETYKNTDIDTNYEQVDKGNGIIEFKCPFCIKTFKKKSKLERHKLQHTKAKPYKCTFPGCTKAYGRKDHLTRHLYSHNSDSIYKCEHEGCNKEFTSPYSLRRHYLWHIKNTKTTNIHVDSTLNKENSINNQFNTIDSTFINVQNTTISSVKSSTLSTIKNDAILIQKNQDLDIQKNINLSTSNKLKCDICGQLFHKKNQLQQHQFIHTGIKPYLCPVQSCGKRFMNKKRLNEHLHIHQGSFHCRIEGCLFNAISSSHLQEHVLQEHKYVCNLCNQHLLNKQNYDLHMKEKHSNLIHIKCTVEGCSRTFTSTKQLQRHLKRTHTPTVLHHCPLCTSIYKDSSSLSRHMKQKHYQDPNPNSQVNNKPLNSIPQEKQLVTTVDKECMSSQQLSKDENTSKCNQNQDDNSNEKLE